jgi:hypothetical protein
MQAVNTNDMPILRQATLYPTFIEKKANFIRFLHENAIPHKDVTDSELLKMVSIFRPLEGKYDLVFAEYIKTQGIVITPEKYSIIAPRISRYLTFFIDAIENMDSELREKHCPVPEAVLHDPKEEAKQLKSDITATVQDDIQSQRIAELEARLSSLNIEPPSMDGFPQSAKIAILEAVLANVH